MSIYPHDKSSSHHYSAIPYSEDRSVASSSNHTHVAPSSNVNSNTPSLRIVTSMISRATTSNKTIERRGTSFSSLNVVQTLNNFSLGKRTVSAVSSASSDFDSTARNYLLQTHVLTYSATASWSKFSESAHVESDLTIDTVRITGQTRHEAGTAAFNSIHSSFHHWQTMSLSHHSQTTLPTDGNNSRHSIRSPTPSSASPTSLFSVTGTLSMSQFSLSSMGISEITSNGSLNITSLPQLDSLSITHTNISVHMTSLKGSLASLQNMANLSEKTATSFSVQDVHVTVVRASISRAIDRSSFVPITTASLLAVSNLINGWTGTNGILNSRYDLSTTEPALSLQGQQHATIISLATASQNGNLDLSRNADQYSTQSSQKSSSWASHNNEVIARETSCKTHGNIMVSKDSTLWVPNSTQPPLQDSTVATKHSNLRLSIESFLRIHKESFTLVRQSSDYHVQSSFLSSRTFSSAGSAIKSFTSYINQGHPTGKFDVYLYGRVYPL